MIATGQAARTTIAVRGIEAEKIMSWLGLGLAMSLSAVLNLWNLAQNGYSNLYYAVAVQSMVQNFSNFFFASYDAGGFITVDKPPVALWMQAISAKIFGFSGLAILLPEALAGVAAVAILFHLVKRVFGTLAATVAAITLALTPIAVAVERTNNTDTWLLLSLLLGAWALSLSLEKGRLALLLGTMVMVGIGFNVKMMAAFIVLPTFYLVYLMAARINFKSRILHLALATVVVFGVAFSWPLAVQLIPADQRPWVGGSSANSVFDLALNYNGLGRVTGDEQGAGGTGRGNFGGGNGGTRPQGGFNQGGRGGNFPNRGGGTLPNNGTTPNGGGFAPSLNGALPNGAPGQFGGGNGGGIGGMFGAGAAGVTRLFTGQLAGLWSWLLPFGILGIVVTVAGLHQKRSWSILRDSRVAALTLWGGWLATYGVVFSMAEGIFHPYYLIMLAPGAAALVGAGVASLWAAFRHGGVWGWLLPLALLVTAAWQFHILSAYPEWFAWLAPLMVGGSLITAVLLVVSKLLKGRFWRQLAPGMVGIALVAVLLAPTAWSVTPVLAGPTNASLPTAGPDALNSNDPTSWTRLGDASNSSLVEFLQANQDGYFYLVAVTNSQQASSIALTTHEPVLAMGGFMGSDPAMTVARLQEMIASKQVRFVMGSGGMGGAMRGGAGTSTSITSWIESNCTAVESNQTGGSGYNGFTGTFSLNNSQLYDCAAR